MARNGKRKPAGRPPAARPRAVVPRQVTCANKRPHRNPHEGVTRLGGPNWGPLTRVHVVTLIEAGIYSFFVLTGERRIEVGVVREQGKRPYLRGRAGGGWSDELLGLPACPRQI